MSTGSMSVAKTQDEFEQVVNLGARDSTQKAIEQILKQLSFTLPAL